MKAKLERHTSKNGPRTSRRAKAATAKEALELIDPTMKGMPLLSRKERKKEHAELMQKLEGINALEKQQAEEIVGTL